jgi:hypothetical protein
LHMIAAGGVQLAGHQEIEQHHCEGDHPAQVCGSPETRRSAQHNRSLGTMGRMVA